MQGRDGDVSVTEVWKTGGDKGLTQKLGLMVQRGRHTRWDFTSGQSSVLSMGA